MGKQEKIAQKLRRKPTPSDVKWRELKNYLEHVGFTEKQGSGSRVKFYYRLDNGGIRMLSLHKNHPSPDVSEGAIEDTVKLLRELDLL